MFDQKILDSIFKAYDIRGLSESELTPELLYAYGRLFVQVLGVKRVAVGRDMRQSGEALKEALVRGITEQGAEVLDVGMVASDMLYFATGKYDVDAGLMMTASHNPKEYNGLKPCLKNAEPIGMENGNGEIKARLAEGSLGQPATAAGKVEQKDIMKDWIDYLLAFVDTASIMPMKVVVDAGNGMGGLVATQLFARLPQIEMIPMYFEPDGNFPNHPANPLDEMNLVDLKGRMEQEGADLGLAFDGDADRCVLVDSNYETLSGTLAICMVSEMLLSKNPHQTILVNAVTGKAARETIEAMGGKCITVRVGHTFIKQAMKEYGAVFGGEHSAHYYFRDNWNADSGIIAAISIMFYLSQTKQNLAQARKKFDKYPQSGEINFRVADIQATVQKVLDKYAGHKVDTLDGWSVFGDGWWFSLRASNTEPLLRLNMEADTKEILAARLEEVQALLRA